MTKDEALKLALEALEANQPVNYCMNNNGEKFPMMHEDPFRFERNTKAITAIKEALAQPEQEPVAFDKTVCPFCTSEWVTAEQHDRNVDRVEQEPFAFLHPQKGFYFAKLTKILAPTIVDVEPLALYTTPQQRKPLTKSQVLDLWEQTYVQRGATGIEFARAIEAAHGIKE